MNGETLNLARRPFVNTRPVTRAALLLWVLGGLLLLGNVSLFWTYLSGSGEKRAELASSRQEIEKERERVERLAAQVARLELASQNERAEFLNRRIAERTFSWSLLFDRLAETLPEQVRLTRLTPSPVGGDETLRGRRGSSSSSRRRDDDAPATDRVTLQIGGEAKTDEALLQLVDNLFAHPFFEDPDLQQDVTDPETGLLRFSLRAIYLPGSAPSAESPEAPRIVEEPREEPAPAESPAAAAGRESAPEPGEGSGEGSEEGSEEDSEEE